MVDIEWVDPPPGGKGRPGIADWDAIAEELKQHPRQWALVAKNVSRATAYNVASGQIRAFRDGLWEVKQRGGSRLGYDSSRCDVYARYLGPWEGR